LNKLYIKFYYNKKD